MMIVKVCAPRQLLLQISQKGLVLIADIFTVEREREREKDSNEKFLDLFDYKMDEQQ